MHGRLGQRVGALLAVAYLATVALIEAARSSGWGPRDRDLASSPAGVVSGQLWRLVTSAFVVAGEPVVQLVGGGIAVIAVVVKLGPGVFWRAAFAGHILATLLAYAGVGVLWLVARPDVDTVVDAPDYGISCVWAGAVGALLAVALRGRRRSVVVVGVLTVAVLAALVPGDPLARVEHLLALALGALVGARMQRRAAAS